MKILTQTLSILIISSFALTSCSSEISADTYSDIHVGETSTTYMATVISVRNVKVAGNDKMDKNESGKTTGAITGGLAGSNIGGGRGNGTALIAGALVGGIAGAIIEKKLKVQEGIEYVLKLEDGSLKTIVQGPGSMIAVGQKALLMVSDKGRSRVIAYSGE
jgi:outer membrane lipoprotein SlyB